ncbi:MAG: response regulator transcription factor [Nitrospira sp.]|nr:response regulator transcription factor [Nitrospira sp.]
MSITLIIADDHPLILEGLKNLFSFEKDFTIVARCANGEETLKALRRYKPEILLLDLHMPGNDGLEVLREMKKEQLPTRSIILTATLNEEEVAQAVSLGIRGLVLKELAPALLVQCIRKVHAGELWLEKGSVAKAFEKLLKREAGRNEATQLLTRREIEIVNLIAAGLRNIEIGERLCISEGTVKMHLHNIYQKLGVDSRTQLIHYCQGKTLI